MEALLRGKRVKLSGVVYEPPRHSPGREWTMVREPRASWWKPAWTDELEPIQQEENSDD